MALCPIKITDENNPNYGNYVFYSFDRDTQRVLNQFELKCGDENVKLARNLKKGFDIFATFNDIITTQPDLDESWKLSANRWNYIMTELSEDPGQMAKVYFEKEKKIRQEYSFKKSRKILNFLLDYSENKDKIWPFLLMEETMIIWYNIR